MKYLEKASFALYKFFWGESPSQHIRQCEWKEAGWSLDLPDRVDLRSSTCMPAPPIVNQRDVPMCAAVAFTTALQCTLRRRGLTKLPVSGEEPSAEKLYKHSFSRCALSNKGLTVRCALQGLQEMYSEDLDSLGLTIKPVERHRIRHTLAQGMPIIAGYLSDDERHSFQASDGESAKADYVLPPLKQIEAGKPTGHCVLLVGYRNSKGKVQAIARNSFGPDWGDKGHFYISLEMLEDPKQTPDLWAFVDVSRPIHAV